MWNALIFFSVVPLVFFFSLVSFDIHMFASSQNIFLKFLNEDSYKVYDDQCDPSIHPSITAYSALKVGGGA